jgi:hypothetical protein
MLKYGLGFLMLLALGLAAFAQPNPDEPLDPNNPQGGGDRNQQRMMALLMARMMDNMPAIQKATPDGIFTVRHGVLLKSDPATLEPKGMIELFGALPAWPKDGKFANDGAELMASLDRMRRAVLCNIAADGKNLYLISGADFFCIDTTTLKIKATGVLFDPDPLLQSAQMLTNPNPMMMMGNATSMFVPAQIEPQGKTIAVLRGNQHLLIDAETGAVLARKDLPAALTATLVPDVKMPGMPDELGAMLGDPQAAMDKAPVNGKTHLIIGAYAPAVGNPTLKTAKGTFILRGAEAAKLAAERAAGATRIAVFGTFTKPVDPKTSAGTLDLQAYLVLSTAK